MPAENGGHWVRKVYLWFYSHVKNRNKHEKFFNSDYKYTPGMDNIDETPQIFCTQ